MNQKVHLLLRLIHNLAQFFASCKRILIHGYQNILVLDTLASLSLTILVHGHNRAHFHGRFKLRLGQVTLILSHNRACHVLDFDQFDLLDMVQRLALIERLVA